MKPTQSVGRSWTPAKREMIAVLRKGHCDEMDASACLRSRFFHAICDDKYCAIFAAIALHVSPAHAPSKPRRILDLVEPVEAHFLDHAVGDHDQPRLRRRMVVEMLVDGEWRHVDEVAPFPCEFLRLVRPLPFEG